MFIFIIKNYFSNSDNGIYDSIGNGNCPELLGNEH